MATSDITCLGSNSRLIFMSHIGMSMSDFMVYLQGVDVCEQLADFDRLPCFHGRLCASMSELWVIDGERGMVAGGAISTSAVMDLAVAHFVGWAQVGPRRRQRHTRASLDIRHLIRVCWRRGG